MEDLLNHMWQEQHWTEERKFKIESPFKDKTKTELVREYVQQGGSIEELLTSYSCYEGGEKHSGQCKACFRKWVSLVNNKIDTPSDYWENNPWESEFLDDIKNSVYNGKWRGKEDKDILKAMITQGNWKV